jgi:hypothetical protein
VNAYQLALEQAKKELADAQSQQRQLSLRISQLEAIVTQLHAFIVKGNANAPSPLFEAVAATTTAQDTGAQPESIAAPVASSAGDLPPLWKAILTALNGDKADFTVPQAVRALERNGRIIHSHNRLNIVRNTLIQREDLFGKHDPALFGPGHYFVRGFEFKRSEDETPAEPAAIEQKITDR